jgi:hypothetical protein
MTILTFLGTVEIADNDSFGTIHLRLALDLLTAIKKNCSDEEIEAKARNIIQVCCEPMFDELILYYEWDKEEVDYADQVLGQCIEMATFELLEISQRRITHKQKHERRTKLGIEDCRLAAMLAYVMSVHNEVSGQLENAFIQDHGAMYFKK